MRSGDKGRCEQGIPCKDRLRLTKDSMVRRFAPSEVIIIHAGKIIMDQTVGVDHFDRRRKRESLLHLTSADLAKSKGQHSAQTFSSCQKAVAHGLKQLLLRLVKKEALMQIALYHILIPV